MHAHACATFAACRGLGEKLQVLLQQQVQPPQHLQLGQQHLNRMGGGNEAVETKLMSVV